MFNSWIRGGAADFFSSSCKAESFSRNSEEVSLAAGMEEFLFFNIDEGGFPPLTFSLGSV